MNYGEAQGKIQSIADKARYRYGAYSSLHEVHGVLAEEFQEALTALHKSDWKQYRLELLDIAAVCLRCASEKTTREEKGEI